MMPRCVQLVDSQRSLTSKLTTRLGRFVFSGVNNADRGDECDDDARMPRGGPRGVIQLSTFAIHPRPVFSHSSEPAGT